MSTAGAGGYNRHDSQGSSIRAVTDMLNTIVFLTMLMIAVSVLAAALRGQALRAVGLVLLMLVVAAVPAGIAALERWDPPELLVLAVAIVGLPALFIGAIVSLVLGARTAR